MDQAREAAQMRTVGGERALQHLRAPFERRMTRSGSGLIACTDRRENAGETHGASEDDEVTFVRAVNHGIVEISPVRCRCSPEGSPHKERAPMDTCRDESLGKPPSRQTDEEKEIAESVPPKASSPADAASCPSLSRSEGVALMFCSNVRHIELVFGERQGDIEFFYRRRRISAVWVQGFIVSVEERAGLFSVDDGTKVLEGTFDVFSPSASPYSRLGRSDSQTHLGCDAPEVVVVDDDEESPGRDDETASLPAEGENQGVQASEETSPARQAGAAEGARNRRSEWRTQNECHDAADCVQESRGGSQFLRPMRRPSLRGTLGQLKKAQREGTYTSLLLQLVPLMVDAEVILSFHLLRISDCPGRCGNAEAEWLTHVLRWRLSLSQRCAPTAG
ncbi:hypothetical protein BESB_077700 [Besnoitia besnoiti]|uniref:Uncharacterized protein n=1 Tax=Besnoitia besnoiti TaxID=94643 RepID=A0A2A9MD04_BESBE|nr:hypothetical protein BESB_077700 [Besnoitia besnoiti]PFH33553.1 hypothetical protein BESB_077700 [Besnoitia besnoiti]